MTGQSQRARRVVGVGVSLVATGAILVGCTHRPRPPHGSTTTTAPVTTPTTDCHGHTGDDHANTSSTFKPCTTPTTDGHGHTDDDHANTTTTAGPTPTTAGTTTTTGHGGHGH